jgi:hypothetical protein
MRIIIDIGGMKDNYLSYTCERCGTQLDKKENALGQYGKILWHPSHDGIIFKGKPIPCEDAGYYCDKPEIIFTATSRDKP